MPEVADRILGEVDAVTFRQALGRFLTGVTVVMTVDPETGQPHGMTASAFLSVSLDPPLVLVSLDRRSRMLDAIGRADHYSVSILDEHQEDLARHFAGQHGRAEPTLCERCGVPALADSLAYIVTRKVATHDAGDHVLVVGQVEELGFPEGGTPLAYFGGQFYRIAPTEAEVLVAWPSHGEPLWM